MEPNQARVRYAETDQMGVDCHANYIVWLEVGRVEFCRASRLSYRDMETEGAVTSARPAAMMIRMRCFSSMCLAISH